MNIILTDNIMEKGESISLIKKYLLKNNNEEFLFFNIDTGYLDLKNKIIYNNKEIIKIKEIKSILPRVNKYSYKVNNFITFIELNSNAIIYNKGIEITNNKLLSSIYTTNHNIPTIPTEMISIDNMDKFKDFPYILKTTDGFSGIEVFKINNFIELTDKVSLLSDKELIIQPFRENGCKDYRIIVSKGKVIFSYMRESTNNDFRANGSQGGKRTPFIIDKAFAIHSIRIAKVLNMDFVGLDFIEHNGVYEFCEANNSFFLYDLNIVEQIISSI